MRYFGGWGEPAEKDFSFTCTLTSVKAFITDSVIFPLLTSDLKVFSFYLISLEIKNVLGV